MAADPLPTHEVLLESRKFALESLRRQATLGAARPPGLGVWLAPLQADSPAFGALVHRLLKAGAEERVARSDRQRLEKEAET